MKEIDKLKMHESRFIASGLKEDFAVMVTRVPNGLIYVFFDKSTQIGTAQFVPYQSQILD